MVPRQHGTGEKQKMEAHHIALMVALVEEKGRSEANTMKTVQKAIEEEMGDCWGYSTINHALNKEHSWQKVTFEDPSKWLPANCPIGLPLPSQGLQ